MKKTFNFGKIDYMNRGRKDCAVDVTICLEERGGEKVFDKDGNFTGEYCDVTIRCYLLGQAISAALDELEEEGKIQYQEEG